MEILTKRKNRFRTTCQWTRVICSPPLGVYKLALKDTLYSRIVADWTALLLTPFPPLLSESRIANLNCKSTRSSFTVVQPEATELAYYAVVIGLTKFRKMAVGGSLGGRTSVRASLVNLEVPDHRRVGRVDVGVDNSFIFNRSLVTIEQS